MFKTITARFPGTCKRCKGPIQVGDRMRYGGRGQTWHLKADCPGTEDGGAVARGESRCYDDIAEYREATGYYDDRIEG